MFRRQSTPTSASMLNPSNPKRRRCMPAIAAVLALLAGITAPSGSAHAERLRDLTDIYGARDNQLLGYGIVTGLNGTGDDVSAPFAAQSLMALMRRLGVQVDPKQLRLRNVAAVVVTGNIPAFAKAGSKLDVTVSSIGNAKSLRGGTLLQSLLKGPDQRTYAVAQGSVLTGGFSAGGKSGSSVQSGTETSGRVPEGAIIEREIPTEYMQNGEMRLSLRAPGFGIASRVAIAINRALGEGTATATDGGSVLIRSPEQYKDTPVDLVARLEDIEVVPVRKARVVISERTSTIVAGGDVRLSPAVIVHGALTIVVKEKPSVSQPNAPFGNVGQTVVVPDSEVNTSEGDRATRFMKGAATLSDVAEGLGALGLPPRELASVLEALRSAGSLEAEVVVQ